MPPNRTSICKCIKRCGGPNGEGREIGYATHNNHMREEASNQSANFQLHLQNTTRTHLQPSTFGARLDNTQGSHSTGEDTRNWEPEEDHRSDGSGLRQQHEDGSDANNMDIDHDPQQPRDRNPADRQSVSSTIYLINGSLDFRFDLLSLNFSLLTTILLIFLSLIYGEITLRHLQIRTA